MKAVRTSGAIPALFEALFAMYGEQHWWPSRSGGRWEIAAGAVLTQNTAWTNVEKALANLERAGWTTPEAILAAPEAALREVIRPAGFFMRKALSLKNVAAFFRDRERVFLTSNDLPALRRELLAIGGVGPETADDILLYAFKKPVFVIDAYTRRVAARHLKMDGALPYDDLQRRFMAALPPDPALYGEYHALILALCKDSCRKSACGPACCRLP